MKTTFKIIREILFQKEKRVKPNLKTKNLPIKKSLYYTEKNSHFVRVFSEKIYKLFSRKRKILTIQARIINIILQFRYLIF